MTSGLPFDDYRDLLRRLPQPDAKARREAEGRLRLLEAQGVGLGRMGELAVWLAGWQGRSEPQIARPMVTIFAGTHGITRHDISTRGQDETQAMVEFCAAGGAAINQICAANDFGLKVFDLALHMPVADISQGPAFDERGCAVTMAFGMEAIAGGADLICVGSLGVGGETVAAALLMALHGKAALDWIKPEGDADMTERRIRLIDQAVALHGGHVKDPLEALRRLGGREIAAISGAILAARMERIPVVLDGIVSLAAAAVLHAVREDALDHCVLGHLTANRGQRNAAAALGLKPLVDLDIGEGEGVGAAMGALVLKNAAQVHASMTIRQN
ncbi:nicotinate-nucleotide--dimethylbenzimidazole phosphoribosyltransferase [Aliihoeflea aestuarii]|jgi:nicotinate-nucleotide--dimethylbenzimidazole phosphoribosyltransferase|uniref:nicotinate-nucleotide--dimethylbenzimidazole phosphoribosyltransferase n=1 Tax=Aliihoeflea aestuarii TaxID=453840 RepID=UPI002091ECDE|nr:nicotinate-nucleotide--dimethylbenzimidazole phosphoribosyltransferase [Aliihoeflea aestuarii]MCO6390292.1 nicotinate-nucleotide--dimethylbenzimidazole phosphoribosyltransferase [Aliihoeflea aestuarii]